MKREELDNEKGSESVNDLSTQLSSAILKMVETNS